MNQNNLTKSQRARYKALQKKRKDVKRGKYEPEFKPYVPSVAWRPDQQQYQSLNQIPAGAVTTHSVMKNLHKESPEVQEAIIAKSKRIAPIYNKGPAAYIQESEVECIGRK